MRSSTRPPLSLFLAAAALLGLPSIAFAQASFAESFDGRTVAGLEADGWSFRNQSENPGPLGWRPDDVTDPYDGTHYLVSDGYCLGGPGTVGSNWAVLPVVPGQVAGDVMTMYLAEGWTSLRSDVLQVRYSPSGGSSTGSGANAVGDFTVLLDEFVHDTIGWWAPHSITLPGPGRIALRYHAPSGRGAGIYVDGLTIGDPPGGPIPLPSAGQTVHWDASLSPITLAAGTTNVVPGGTVIVDAGVVVVLEPGATLNVDGAIEFREGTTLDAGQGAYLVANHGGSASFVGTPSERITIHGDQQIYAAGVRAWTGSSLTMRYVDADTACWVASVSTAVVDHASFTGTSGSPNGSVAFRLYDATLAIRDSSFLDTSILEERGYLLLDRSTLTNSQAVLQRGSSPTPLYLNDLLATGNASDAPFVVHSFDVLLGPDNVIQANAWPVRLATGGLHRDSVLPRRGNANDFIPGIARFGSRATWPDLGLDYVLAWDNDIPRGSGRLTIDPGVTARFERGVNTVADAFPIQFFADLVCRGTPDAPILLTDNGAGWGGLAFGDNSSKRPKLEHTIVSRADTGAIATLCDVWLQSCRMELCGRGAQSNSFGSIIARDTEFASNSVGVETSPGTGVGINAGHADLNGLDNPNSFAGNGVGVQIMNPGQTTVDARGNWWGDASGPTHPSNPGGQGDSAGPTATVLPFETADPASDGHAPIVRLMPLGSVLEEGTKVFLRWDVEDDGQLVSQRLEYSPHGSNPGLSTLIDGIGADVRTLEVVIPQSPPSSNNQLPLFRLVAIDDTGREGWDEHQFFTPYEDFELEFTVDTPAAVVRPGENHDVCWSINYADAYLMLDDVNYAISLGGTTTNCLSGGMKGPGVSTDLARIIVVSNQGAGGRSRYEYSDYFSIRPDPVIGDAPPSVGMIFPGGGSFMAGGTVPIVWTASDDEGLRSFTIQASYDGGRAWNVVVQDLPGDVFSYDWQLPANGTALADVLVRVVANDLRFQASSDTATFSIEAPSALPGARRQGPRLHRKSVTVH